jgi:hypothetical protein
VKQVLVAKKAQLDFQEKMEQLVILVHMAKMVYKELRVILA